MPSINNVVSINDVVSLYTSWEGRLAYRQAEGRLNPVQSGFGDCSSTIWRAYKDVLGIDVGTWTGEQVGKGQHVMSGSYTRGWDTTKLRPGDLVLMGQGGISHVELYVGNNQFSGHGGPGYGPTRKNASQYISWWKTWTVRRHIDTVTATPGGNSAATDLERLIASMKATHIIFNCKGTVYIADVLAGTYRGMPNQQTLNDTVNILKRAGAKVAYWSQLNASKSNNVSNPRAFGKRETV